MDKASEFLRKVEARHRRHAQQPEQVVGHFIGDLDLFYEDRVPASVRGRIRELAVQLVLGEIPLHYFVAYIRGEEWTRE